MNNDAFRALINKQHISTAGEKSTKEIAREAVENEFQKKRRRGGGGSRRGRGFNAGNDGSDSCDSSDEDRGGERDMDATQEQKTNEDEPDWKRRRREKRLQDGSGGSGAGGVLEYRDRAKERREGTNMDYASMEGLSAQSGEDDRRRQAELSKYLGGDEEHTHLVKGLDKALAEKVRREEVLVSEKKNSKEEAEYLDQLLEDAHTLRKQQKPMQAGGSNWRMAKPRTELGKSVLSYLLQKEQTYEPSAVASTVCNPSVLRSIQQSVLTFSLDSDVRKQKSSWAVPRISLKALATQHAGEGNAGRIMSPLSHHIVAAISKKLDARTGSKGKSKNQYSNAKKNGEGMDKTVASKAADDCNDKHKEDDTDDDIFADVGSYDPQAMSASNKPDSTAATATKSTEVKGNNENSQNDNKLVPKEADIKQAKKSIFEYLIQTGSSAKSQIQRRQLRPYQLQPIQENKNVIDRDIFGGQDINSAQLPYQVRRGPQSAMIEGVSMTTYEGGYGEEMDVDFGNDDDEWQTLNGEREKGGEGLAEDAEDADKQLDMVLLNKY